MIINKFLATAALSLFALTCSKESTSDQSAPASKGAPKIVAITAGDDGFQPSRVEVDKGVPTTLRFTRTSKDTCATKVVFPEIKLEKDLPLNQAVDVPVPTDKARTLVFQCGMGMFKSSLVIS